MSAEEIAGTGAPRRRTPKQKGGWSIPMDSNYKRPLPAVGGNIVVSRAFNDDVAGNNANGLRHANTSLLVSYLFFLYVFLGWWLLYLIIPRGIRGLLCWNSRSKNGIHAFDRNRMVREWIVSLIRGPRRRARSSRPPPVLNVSLPHSKAPSHPLDDIHAALEDAESKHEEQKAQERNQRNQFHRKVAAASIHAIEEAHSDHSMQLRREREERRRKEEEKLLAAAAMQAANESVDAVFVVGSDSGFGSSYHTDAESTVTMSQLQHAESKETYPSDSVEDVVLDRTIEGASTIVGSISQPATSTAVQRHHDMSPSSMSLNSYANYDPLANHHTSRYSPQRRPLPSTTETSAPSDEPTIGSSGDGLSSFTIPVLEDPVPEEEPLTTAPRRRSGPTPQQPAAVRFPMDDSFSATLLDVQPNAGKHPSETHRVPGIRVLQETEVRLRGNGVRLTAHGVKVAAKQVWIRVDGAILWWQTERLVQGPTSSYIWARGPWRDLPLASVLYVDVGKRTTALQYLSTVVDADQCFSLLTSGGSLDLQAHSKLERDAIVACLIVCMDIQNIHWRTLYEESSPGTMSSVGC